MQPTIDLPQIWCCTVSANFCFAIRSLFYHISLYKNALSVTFFFFFAASEQFFRFCWIIVSVLNVIQNLLLLVLFAVFPIVVSNSYRSLSF